LIISFYCTKTSLSHVSHQPRIERFADTRTCLEMQDAKDRDPIREHMHYCQAKSSRKTSLFALREEDDHPPELLY
jgi:hypothetical protein